MLRILIVAALLLAPLGCAPYVNIPPQKGDTLARHDINAPSIRKITIPALQAVVDQNPPAGQFMVILPEPVQRLTYAAILPQISENAVAPFDDEAIAVAAYEVKQIRIRANKGEVDILRPGPGGTQQLVTVYLENPPFSDWIVDRLRVWRGPVEIGPVPIREAP